MNHSPWNVESGAPWNRWGLRDDERMAMAMKTAKDLGHHVVCDSIGFRRFTCTNLGCGRALLMPEGIIYGSALTERCEPRR